MQWVLTAGSLVAARLVGNWCKGVGPARDPGFRRWLMSASTHIHDANLAGLIRFSG
jgi:hypothetical protein